MDRDRKLKWVNQNLMLNSISENTHIYKKFIKNKLKLIKHIKTYHICTYIKKFIWSNV